VATKVIDANEHFEISNKFSSEPFDIILSFCRHKNLTFVAIMCLLKKSYFLLALILNPAHSMLSQVAVDIK
jgi:hypothetical protein